VPTRTQRYNRDGERIGYEEGEAYETTIDSTPVCGWCGTRFEFPRAQSKEQYFNAKKELGIRRWHAAKPGTDDGFSNVFVVFALGVTVGILSTAWITSTAWIPVTVGLTSGVGAVILWAKITVTRENARGKKTTPEMQAWQEGLRQWESMEYTEANYQHVRDWRP